MSDSFTFSDPTKKGDFFNDLRRKELHTDVIISIGNIQFKAHRIFLMSSSEYFEKMFTSTFIEKNSSVVEISEESVSAEVFEDILGYIYTGNLRIVPKDMLDLTRTSHYLRLTDLFDGIIQHLKQNLSKENILQAYLIAEKYDCKELFTKCLDFMSLNCDFWNNELFGNFEMEDFLCFSKHYSKFCIFAEDWLEMISTWIEKDFSNRQKYFVELLKCIPLKFVNREMLRDFSIKIKIDSNLDSSFEEHLQLVPPKVPQSLYVFGGKSPKMVVLLVKLVSSDKEWFSRESDLEELDHFEDDLDRYQIIGNHQTCRVFDKMKRKLCKFPRAQSYLSVRFCAFCVHKGVIYSVGGVIDDIPTARAECYGWNGSKSGKELSEMKHARKSCELVACGNYLYAIGGIGSDFRILKSVERYDPESDEWTEVASTHGEHSHSISVVKDEKIFVSSGNTFEAYFPNENVWKKLPSPEFDSGKYNTSADLDWNLNVLGRFDRLGHLDGNFYVLGRFDQYRNIYTSETKVFQPATRTWEDFKRLPDSARRIIGLTVLNDVL